ncbi:C40 family peptidase [Actinocorallia longicatena]|uniref:C40 family peptidase n=1 Tax=Actinocorallia longicatena TaxID=111803 RepID=A0ABP6QCH2_9ACTN
MVIDRQQPRRWAAVCLALALAWSLPGMGEAAHAAPEPTKAQAKKDLEKLNDQVDLLVDKLNKANGDLKIARRKMDAAKRAADRENANFDKARVGIVQMAQDAYKSGDMTSVSTLVSNSDPQILLDQVALFSQLSSTRGDKIREFLNAAQRREREKGHAQEALNTVQTKVKEIKDQKTDIDKQVVKQEKLLRRLGVDPDPAPGKLPPVGGTYTGPASGNARKALDYAFAQKGKPYGYGQSGPSRFDCSGLTMMAWKAAGVSLPHNAASQYSVTSNHRISFDNLEPGDLVFFSGLGHVGLYVGNGKMIHAPHTGTFVSVVSISSGYYRSRFVGGGRP